MRTGTPDEVATVSISLPNTAHRRRVTVIAAER